MDCDTREPQEPFATDLRHDLPLGNVPVVATDELREYDPATPIHQGWKTYTYSLREVDTDGGESSLERAMRLRQELLDLLEECCEASTPTSSLFEDNTQVGFQPRAHAFRESYRSLLSGKGGGGRPSAPSKLPRIGTNSSLLDRTEASTPSGRSRPIKANQKLPNGLAKLHLGGQDFNSHSLGISEGAAPVAADSKDLERVVSVGLSAVTLDTENPDRVKILRRKSAATPERATCAEEVEQNEGSSHREEGKKVALPEHGGGMQEEKNEDDVEQDHGDKLGTEDRNVGRENRHESTGKGEQNRKHSTQKQSHTRKAMNRRRNQHGDRIEWKVKVEQLEGGEGSINEPREDGFQDQDSDFWVEVESELVQKAVDESKEESEEEKKKGQMRNGGRSRQSQNTGVSAGAVDDQDSGVEFGNTGVWKHVREEEGTPTGGTIMKAMIAGIPVSIPLPAEAFCAWEKRSSSARKTSGNCPGSNPIDECPRNNYAFGGGGGDSFCFSEERRDDLSGEGSSPSGSVKSSTAGYNRLYPDLASSSALPLNRERGHFIGQDAPGKITDEKGTGRKRQIAPGPSNTTRAILDISDSRNAHLSEKKGRAAGKGRTDHQPPSLRNLGVVENIENLRTDDVTARLRTPSTSRQEGNNRVVAATASAIAGVGWRELRRDTVTALVRQLSRSTAERDRLRYKVQYGDKGSQRRSCSYSSSRLPHLRHRQHSAQPIVPMSSLQPPALPISPGSVISYSSGRGDNQRRRDGGKKTRTLPEYCEMGGASFVKRTHGKVGSKGDRYRDVGVTQVGSRTISSLSPKRRSTKASIDDIDDGFDTMDIDVLDSSRESWYRACKKSVGGVGYGDSDVSCFGIKKGVHDRRGIREAGNVTWGFPTDNAARNYGGGDQGSIKEQAAGVAQEGRRWGHRRQEGLTRVDGSRTDPVYIEEVYCSPTPRSTRQAALLVRGAVRPLARRVLLSAWKRWRLSVGQRAPKDLHVSPPHPQRLQLQKKRPDHDRDEGKPSTPVSLTPTTIRISTDSPVPAVAKGVESAENGEKDTASTDGGNLSDGFGGTQQPLRDTMKGTSTAVANRDQSGSRRLPRQELVEEAKESETPAVNCSKESASEIEEVREAGGRGEGGELDLAMNDDKEELWQRRQTLLRSFFCESEEDNDVCGEGAVGATITERPKTEDLKNIEANEVVTPHWKEGDQKPSLLVASNGFEEEKRETQDGSVGTEASLESPVSVIRWEDRKAAIEDRPPLVKPSPTRTFDYPPALSVALPPPRSPGTLTTPGSRCSRNSMRRRTFSYDGEEDRSSASPSPQTSPLYLRSPEERQQLFSFATSPKADPRLPRSPKSLTFPGYDDGIGGGGGRSDFPRHPRASSARARGSQSTKAVAGGSAVRFAGGARKATPWRPPGSPEASTAPLTPTRTIPTQSAGANRQVEKAGEVFDGAGGRRVSGNRPTVLGGVYEGWFARSRSAGAALELSHAAAAPKFTGRRPTYLAPTASSRHKRRSATPVKVSRSRGAPARKAFIPSGIAKSPPSSPSPPPRRTRKPSLAWRESSYLSGGQGGVFLHCGQSPTVTQKAPRQRISCSPQQKLHHYHRSQFVRQEEKRKVAAGVRVRRGRNDRGVLRRTTDGNRDQEGETRGSFSPFEAVHSRSFDTGDFFYDISDVTPHSSPSYSPLPDRRR